MKHDKFSSLSILFFLLCVRSFVFSQEIKSEAPDAQTSGRIEFVEGRWTKQKARTPDYGFEVFVFLNKDNPELRKWKDIKVLNRRTGEFVQSIDAEGEGVVFPVADELVGLTDFNFDGEMDFYIKTADGGAGPNDSSDFFIFDKKNKRFVLDDELSKMTQVLIDSKNKKITSAYRDGCCRHHEETYAYRAGSRVLIHAWDQVLTMDGWLETSVGQLIGKKMRYKTTRVKQKIQ